MNENKTIIYGNYLCGGAVSVEENLTFEKIHDIVNGWRGEVSQTFIGRRTNETVVSFLENGLVLFNHFTEESKNQSTPNLIIENHYVYGTYIIARMENGKIISLTSEDIKYIDGCYLQIEILRKAINDTLKKNAQRENKNG